MKNYVISLSHAQKRREHIAKQFGEQGIDFEFFDAITPDKADEFAQKFAINLQGAFLTDGEKACLLSHVCLWQQAVDDGLDYIAIFEDDVYLGENANIFFHDSQWLKDTGIDYLKTETFLQERKLFGTPIHLPDNRYAKTLNESHLGTAGYIISQKAAQSLLVFIKNLPKESLHPIDHLMFDDYRKAADTLPIYQILPAIVAQEFILYPAQNTMPSDIKNCRDERKKNKPKRSLAAKIKGELSNAYRKSFGKLSRTKITFR